MEHYFTNNPNLKSELRELSFSYQNINFSFLSDNGIFAKNKIDYASQILLQSFLREHEQEREKRILDVGCGYGFIGIVASKVMDSTAELIDVNKRAIHLCEENIKRNKVNAKTYESNCYDNVEGKFDYIITNPPIRAGKEVVLSILNGAKEHLLEGGELWFVINKDQGAKSTKKLLESSYNIEVVEKSKGFFCFKAKIS